jgi:hypothetical protein
VVASVKGLYAGLLEKVGFTILQRSNWNLLHPKLISKGPETAPSKSGHIDTSLNTPTQVLSVNAIISDHIQQK